MEEIFLSLRVSLRFAAQTGRGKVSNPPCREILPTKER